MMNKNNVPYYIAGTLATFTLLASGVFAAAPYIGFLAPVAALSVGLPFIIGGAVFSAVAIALSYAAVSKNKTISELKNEMKAQEQEISELKNQVQIQKQEISELKNEVKAQKQTISKKDDQLAKQVEEIKGKGKTIVEQKKLITEKDKKIEEDALKVAVVDNAVHGLNTAGNASYRLVKETVNGVLYSSKYIYNHIPSTKSVKEKLSNASNAVGNSLKGVYNAMPSTRIGFSWVSEKFSSYWDSAKNLMFGNKADQTSDASQLSSKSQNNGIVIPEGARIELFPILSDFLFREKQKMVRQFLREQTDEKKNVATQENLKTETPSQENQMNIDNVPKQPDHLNVDAAKSYLMSLSEDQDVFYDAESGNEKGTEISSPESQPTKEENGQGWFAWSLGKVKSAMTEVVVIDADVTKPYCAKVTKALAT